jgi:hypothetical protein
MRFLPAVLRGAAVGPLVNGWDGQLDDRRVAGKWLPAFLPVTFRVRSMPPPLAEEPTRRTGCVSRLEQVQHVSIVIDFSPAIARIGWIRGGE